MRIITIPEVDENLIERRGRVRISRTFIFTTPEFLPVLFSVFFPLDTQPQVHLNSDIILYWGLSPAFRIVDDGEMPPEYELSFRRNGKDEFEFVAAKEVNSGAFEDEFVNVWKQGKVGENREILVKDLNDLYLKIMERRKPIMKLSDIGQEKDNA